MKSLFKIIRRYISSTILLVAFVVLLNILALTYVAVQYEEGLNQTEGLASTSASQQLEDVAAQLEQTPDGYRISQKGLEILNDNRYIWGMLLDGSGSVVWEWQLPEDFARSYSLADVASFSRWYLKGLSRTRMGVRGRPPCAGSGSESLFPYYPCIQQRLLKRRIPVHCHFLHPELDPDLRTRALVRLSFLPVPAASCPGRGSACR